MGTWVWRGIKAKLARIVGIAGKIVGAKQDSLSDFYLTAVERKTARILDDAKHPLLSQFQKHWSGRRYKLPIARVSKAEPWNPQGKHIK